MQDVHLDESVSATDPRAWAWSEMKDTVNALQNQLVGLAEEKELQPWLDPNFKVCCDTVHTLSEHYWSFYL